jgi:hypothetical protein
MAVLHVEDNAITRASLAHLVGVRNGRISGHAFIATGIVAAAMERLNQGTVIALVLDIGLNAPWDNKHMRRALHDLLVAPDRDDPAFESGLGAHRLAMLARTHNVPCALLTNWPDYLNEEDGCSERELREAFGADEVFRKDETGMTECAAWVRQHLS